MSVVERIDQWQQRHPVVGFPLATIYKFGDDFGNYLSALLTYYAFVSILPLLLLASTVLSWVLVDNPGLQKELLDSALGSFPVVGQQLKAPEALSGGTAGVVVGVIVATYGALGVAQALQYAGNTTWGVPRNSRPNPFLSRGRSFIVVLLVGVSALIAVSASIFLHKYWEGSALGLRIIGFLVGALVFTVGLIPAFQLAIRQHLKVSVMVPGAIFAGVGLQLLQTFGYSYVDGVIRHASDINAVFATVIGMLAYLYLAATIVVLGMELNAVRAHRLWPRALLTPFTDDVDLTPADHAAYRRQAQAQRHKGYQEIEVVFHERPRPDEVEETVSDTTGDATPPRTHRSAQPADRSPHDDEPRHRSPR